MRILPMDVVHLVQSYLPWKERTVLISRQWLQDALAKKTRLNKWRSLVRVYSFLVVFGQKFTSLSWHGLCRKLDVNRRKRNKKFKLTWRAAAVSHMESKCVGCGNHTMANVMGWRVCGSCRYNHTLPECFMVSVGTAICNGVTKTQLENIPYHSTGMYGPRLRFWKDVAQYADGRRLRYLYCG